MGLLTGQSGGAPVPPTTITTVPTIGRTESSAPTEFYRTIQFIPQFFTLLFYLFTHKKITCRAAGDFFMFSYASLALAMSHRAVNATASLMAISDSILRLISTPASFRPCMKVE